MVAFRFTKTNGNVFAQKMNCWILFFYEGVYISETVHASLRGSLAVFQSLFISIGMLIVMGLGYFLKDWRTLAWVCMIPGNILIINLTMFKPESKNFSNVSKPCLSQL